MFYYYGEFNLNLYMDNDDEMQSARQEEESAAETPHLCLCVTRRRKNLPISDVEILMGERNKDPRTGELKFEFKVPQHLKHIRYQFGAPHKNRLLCYRQKDVLNMHFEAKQIDRYPAIDRSYYEMPDLLSTFCFPSGIQFTKERETPTFFSFILTDSELERIYGTCLIFDEILCPELRHLLKQHHVTNLDSIYVHKAICILSHYSFMDSFKEILKQVYRIHLSNTPIPMERYIINVMEEIPVPDIGSVLVQYDIGNQTVPFFRKIDQFPPYASDEDIENLFRALDYE